jgi:hypothetical protein
VSASTDTLTLIKAMRVLAREIQSADGVANAAITEAANRLWEQSEQIRRMEKALDRFAPRCEHLHHEKSDLHTSAQPCPVEAMVRKAKEAKPC